MEKPKNKKKIEKKQTEDMFRNQAAEMVRIHDGVKKKNESS